MLQAACAAAPPTGARVFELFPRRLPDGPPVRRGGRRRPGARRARGFRFGRGRAGPPAATQRSSTTRPWSWLAGYRFRGDVWGYAEGEVYFPCSPLMVVEATFAEAVLLETVLLSIFNHDSAIASAASRMTWPRATGRASRWARGAPTRRRRSPRRARRTSPGSPPPPTSRRGGATACRPPAPARTRFTLLHDSEADAFQRPGATRWARARRCSSTPTTSPRRCALGGRGRRARAGRRADRLRRPRRARPPGARSSSTSSAPPAPGSW